MARDYPTDLAGFRRIHGVGEKKLADLGPAFVAAIAEHLAARDVPAVTPTSTRA
jgi:superfamily II DNA helicase RecQ